MAQNLISATFPEADPTEEQQNHLAAKTKIIFLLGVQPMMSPQIHKSTNQRIDRKHLKIIYRCW